MPGSPPPSPSCGAAAERDHRGAVASAGRVRQHRMFVFRVVHPSGPTGPRRDDGAGPHRVAELRVRSPPRPAGCADGDRRGLRDLYTQVRPEPRLAPGRGERAVDVEERRLASVCRPDDHAADRLADDAARGPPLSDRADRWDHSGRPHGAHRAGHRERGQKADSGSARRAHRAPPRREGAAPRPRGSRVGSRPGGASL